MKRTIILATEADKENILKLYQTMLYGPADWNEHYPSEETIAFDLSRDALYIMKDEMGEILAAISIDEDEEVAKLPCWGEETMPCRELARLCVREDVQNQGIGKEMMRHMFGVLKEMGNKGVHILVKTGHVVALGAYEKLGFQVVGSCQLYEKDFVCMEMCL